MLSDLRAAPPNAIVLLQTPPHNPTGLDPTTGQWEEIAAVVKERHLVAFFDAAFHVSNMLRIQLYPQLYPRLLMGYYVHIV